MREDLAPLFYIGKEGGIDFGGPFAAPRARGEFIEGTFEYRFPGEERGDLFPSFFVLIAGDIENAADSGLVVFIRLLPAVVDRELKEV